MRCLGDGCGAESVGQHWAGDSGFGLEVQSHCGGGCVRHVHLHRERVGRPRAACQKIVVEEDKRLGGSAGSREMTEG
jgi:hypothetical protein